MDEEDNSIGFFAAWQSGLSVGVPGTPRVMEVVHERYGRKPWPRVLQPAISLAQSGFELTERTSSQVAGLLARNASCEDRLFFRDPEAFAYFANPDCSAKPAGTLIRNKAYANTLKAIRNRGADAFYFGPIAEDIASAVQGDPAIAGDMTVEAVLSQLRSHRTLSCMHRVQRLQRLRYGSTLFRRAGRRSDPGRSRELRPRLGSAR